MGWFDFFRKTKSVATPKADRREDVVAEDAAHPPADAKSDGIVVQCNRDIIHESLEIAARTKRRNTAESRLGVAEQLLDELAEQGLETMEDRINRQTLCALRRDLEQRFKG